MIERFVNTASTAGGDGTTNAISGANRAFATLLEAINSLPATLTDQTTITCEGTAADTSAVNQAPWDMTTSATNYLLIRTLPANRHNGAYDTTKYRIEVTNSDGLYSNIPAHMRWEGLQVQITSTTSGVDNYICFRQSNLNVTGADIDLRCSHCVAKVVRTGTDNVFGWANDLHSGTGTVRPYNCVASGATFGFSGNDASMQYANCTGVGNDFNYIDPQTDKNCLGASPLVGDSFLAVTGGNNNASTDATAPGTSSRQNQTFSFVNQGAGNFHLTSSDLGAKDFGQPDPFSGLFSDDIDGVARTGAWDIGADEFVAAAPSCALTGTATGSIMASDVVTGGKTIVMTLSGDTWIGN